MIRMRVLRVAVCASWFSISCDLLPAFGQERIVNVYGWSDYVDTDVIKDFTKETGIKVIYDVYNSDETLEAQLQSGKTVFDVVIVSGRVLQGQIAAGLYLALDKSRLPNSKNLWPEVMARLAAYDPGNQYAVNYMWFTVGIAYNVEKAKKLMRDAPALNGKAHRRTSVEARESAFTSLRVSPGASAAPLAAPLFDAWSILFKLENLKKFSSCGVNVLDSPEDLFAIARQYLWSDWRFAPGLDRQTELKRAADLLSGVRRNVNKFDSSKYADALANGDICLAVGYSLDSFRARDQAREAKNGIEIDYAIPREGAPILLDNLVIPKEAPHVEEAYAFIDFLLRPEIAARNTNFTHLANSIPASKFLIDKNISGNKSIYPDAAVMQRLFVPEKHDLATQNAIAREWARIKMGK